MDLEAMCTPTFPASFVVFFSLTSDEPSPASRLFGHGFGGSFAGMATAQDLG